ncbi:MAG: sulfatase-like hydrolase/transferase [Planctomycetes bacterium]|nr:sulfatase-like hydrolase/transferase [Planctomycetota bacterium]
MAKKPNILFLMSDQHRFDISGFMGDDLVKTPCLDRLAEDAVIFDNAYTPSPVCVPGRQCLMSGQLPHSCKCYNYGDDLEPNYNTFARVFSQHAYDTTVCGKLHHTGLDQNQGWSFRAGYDSGVSSHKYLPGFKKEEAKKYRQENQWWTWDKEVRKAGIGTCAHLEKDNIAISSAQFWIKERFNSPYYDKENHVGPCLLKVSLCFPHYPFLCDEDKFNYYLNRVQPYTDQKPSGNDHVDGGNVIVGEDVSERDTRRATAAYYGMIEMLDEQFAKIIDALEEVNEDIDDWIIVYTTDHGELMGEHSLWMKYKFYEGSVKVPLFIRYPKNYTGKRVSENVNLCDLYATLLDLSDIECPDGLDSRSMCDVMNGDASKWNNESVSQLGETLMIKQDDLKYQYHGSNKTEMLFDLKKDPGELVDYIDDPAYAGDVSKFRARCAALGSGPDADANYQGAGY